jgi:hypothetical protein
VFLTGRGMKQRILFISVNMCKVAV